MPKTTKRPAATKKSAPATKKEAPPSVGLKKGKMTGKTPKTEPVPEPQNAGPGRTSDPRLPAVGTVIQKRDRHGALRCECTVEEGGIRYAGTLYRSISSAALAAAKDLGLQNKTENGYVFWGLVKLNRPGNDPVAAFERAWERYRKRAEILLRAGLTDESRDQLKTALGKQTAMIVQLRERAGLAQR